MDLGLTVLSVGRQKPAVFDLTVVSPLNSTTLNEARARSGSAAGKAEVHRVGLGLHTLGSKDLWLLGGGSSGFHFSAGCPSGFAIAVLQVKGHCKHLPKTEPHLSSLQCLSLAIQC